MSAITTASHILRDRLVGIRPSCAHMDSLNVTGFRLMSMAQTGRLLGNPIAVADLSVDGAVEDEAGLGHGIPVPLIEPMRPVPFDARLDAHRAQAARGGPCLGGLH